MKKLRFVKITCECGHVNLIPVYRTFRLYETIRCEQCNRVIAKPISE